MILREAKHTTLQRAAEGRHADRRELRLQTGSVAEGGIAEVMIHNLSATGALIQSSAALVVGDRIEIELPHTGNRTAQIVWSDDGLYGCRFDEPLSKGAISAALLRSPSTPAWSDEQLTSAIAFEPEPIDNTNKLHPAARAAILIGFTAACWAGIAGVALAIF